MSIVAHGALVLFFIELFYVKMKKAAINSYRENIGNIDQGSFIIFYNVLPGGWHCELTWYDHSFAALILHENSHKNKVQDFFVVSPVATPRKLFIFTGKDGHYEVTFGVLFNDDRCANIFEALVGTLKAAKRKKVITYDGELLLQGISDNVVITLMKEELWWIANYRIIKFCARSWQNLQNVQIRAQIINLYMFSLKR